MGDMVRSVEVDVPGKGIHDVTQRVRAVVRDAGVREGLCTVFVQHTSASLVVQENADPAVRRDLERWMDALAPESEVYEHDAEGPDDMPAHLRAAVTAVSLSVPIVAGDLGLGRWQAIYLWEHRRAAGRRTLLVHVG